MKISIGIPAYNEEKNIGALLDALENQKLTDVEIDEILVIASGCTDNTVPIVLERIKKNPDIFIFTEPERKGKASAINLFNTYALNRIHVLSSADIIPAPNCIEKLCKPFDNPNVGMTGARVVPQNDANTFVGFLSCFRWSMSHVISLKHPVLGELVAFRNVVKPIPITAADETCIENAIIYKGLEVVYVPKAIVYNRGPETLKEYIQRRRRIFTGQLQNRKLTGYSAASQNTWYLIGAVAGLTDWYKCHWVLAAIAIEVYCRALGTWDFYTKKEQFHIWEPAATTKQVKEV